MSTEKVTVKRNNTKKKTTHKLVRTQRVVQEPSDSFTDRHTSSLKETEFRDHHQYKGGDPGGSHYWHLKDPEADHLVIFVYRRYCLSNSARR